MKSCLCCFEDWIGPCNGPYDLVTINTSLTPLATYFWRITDKFMKIYQGEVQATIDGKIQIACDNLPDGFFNAYAGEFTIEILDGGCKPITFQITSEYDCIQLTINGGNSDKRDIGCEPGSGTIPSSNATIEFVDNDEVDIDWSQFASTFGNQPTIKVFQADDTLPNIYHEVIVGITYTRNASDILQSIHIDLGGPMDGYVLITN